MKENLSLIDEVRRDAFEKSRGVEKGERCFELISFMCKLNELARKEGLLAVAETEVPSNIDLSGDIRQALDRFVETASTDDLTKILTDQYWDKNFQGENALLYYMIILSFVNLGIKNSQEFEQLLLSCLDNVGVTSDSML